MMINILLALKIAIAMIDIKDNTVFFRDKTKYLYPVDFVTSPEWVSTKAKV